MTSASLEDVSMSRFGLAAAVAALAIIAPSYATNPVSGEIAALRKQVGALRTQEKAYVQAIHNQFETIINRDKLSEEVLIQERKLLAKQEAQLVAAAVTEADKEAIRLRFEAIRNALHTDIKLDAQQIKILRAEEHQLIERVKLTYNAAVKHVEAEIHALEHMPKPGTSKPKK
jgi:hypothetical protein